jgi:DHA2 family multidrug resistance protein
MIERREQFHVERVGEYLDPFNPTVTSFLEQSTGFYTQQTGDPAGSAEMALETLSQLRESQAASLAYFDDFWLFAVIPLGLVLLVPLMRRSVAEKGEPIGAE